MNSSEITKVSLPIVLVVSSYFLGSVLLKGEVFYLFDVIWRISIILLVIKVGKLEHKITSKQWFILALVFSFEIVLYSFLAPNLSIERVAISVALAPIAEEFLFRGWLMSKIHGSNKEKILISSILFGLYHFKNAFVLTPQALIYQITYATLIAGPIFALVRLRFNSIFASLMLHSLNNTYADTITTKILPFITKRNSQFG